MLPALQWSVLVAALRRLKRPQRRLLLPRRRLHRRLTTSMRLPAPMPRRPPLLPPVLLCGARALLPIFPLLAAQPTTLHQQLPALLRLLRLLDRLESTTMTPVMLQALAHHPPRTLARRAAVTPMHPAQQLRLLLPERLRRCTSPLAPPPLE